MTIAAVLGELLRRPTTLLVQRWNWKSALLSSVLRGMLFFAANLTAGRRAALAAMGTEFVYRGIAAGFYAALTQAFCRVKPERQAILAVLLLLPVVSHTPELIVHWWCGTPRLGAGLALSVAFTLLATSFSLFAMRRGVLIVGAGSQSLWRDLLRLPPLAVAFVRACVKCAPVRRARLARRPSSVAPCRSRHCI